MPDPPRSTRRIVRMENARRVVQVLVFVGFLYLFMTLVGRYDPASRKIAVPGGSDLFFHLDMLCNLTWMVSARAVTHVALTISVLVVLVTVLGGRLFCGWICPLGTSLDAADTLFFRRRKRQPVDTSRRNIKYYLLVAVLIAAAFSSQIAYLFDPIAIITRAMTLAVYPIMHYGARSLADAGVDFAPITNSPYLPSDAQYFFRLNFLAAIVFVGILAADAISRRYWCRNLCPLGALLGIFSRFSLIRRQVRETCVKCAKCVPGCKMGAIMDDPTQYQAPECIYCYACTSVCPSLSTRIAPSIRKDGYHSSLDINRRRLLQAGGIGAMVALLGKTNVAAKNSRTGGVRVSSEVLIRPPGALPEGEFAERCVRCSECMKVCPTVGLQPAITEAGLEGLWTPVLVPRLGECTQNCSLCSQVCPSQAIQPFEIPEKSHIYIGRAVIDRSQCIAWNSGKQCLVCDEACSYDAIYWQMADGVKRPFVEEHKCVGCGICENVCPIQPVAAIRVFSFGDRRNWTRDQQKMFFDQAQPNPNPT